MRKLIIRILLKALAIMYLFPWMKGTEFHGNFAAALALAVFFSLLLSFAEFLAGFAARVLTISTLGLALLVIIPARILCFWLLPTISLVLISNWFPHMLIIHSWLSAAMGGLVLLTIGLITRSRKR